MRLTIVTLVSLLLVNCTRSKDGNGEQKPAVFVKEKSSACAPLGFSHDEPLAVWKMQNGVELILCNAYETKIVSEDEFTGWLNVYVRVAGGGATGGLSPYIKEVVSEMPSELYHFTVKREGAASVRVVRKLNAAGGGLAIPLSEFVISCTGSGCERTAAETCLTLPAKVDAAAVGAALKAGAGSKAGAGLDSGLIGRVVESALAGDARARRFILEAKADGHAAEMLRDGRELVQVMTSLGCLKKK